MSRRYAADHKNLVLKIFAAVFEGDAAATSRFTGVPERTIRDWFYAYMEAIARETAAESVAKVAKVSKRR
jgi:hypothetical protein